MYTAGIDVGSSSVKGVLMSFDENGESEKLEYKTAVKIRRQNIKDVIEEVYEDILRETGTEEEDISYIASTGEGELVEFRTGHFYSMTTHARGALFMDPEVRALIDAGALHTKGIIIDERGKVLDSKMTSQCASGSGQFLENIARYLGIALNEVGELSLKADDPKVVSNICAVLAETDVIDMVSKEISVNNILKGIHISMAQRLISLLRRIEAEGKVLITGGLAADEGFIAALQELADEDEMNCKFVSHGLSLFAGAIGTAIWGAFRYVTLKRKDKLPV